MTEKQKSTSTTLRIIAIFKLLQGLLLVVTGLGALGLLNPDWQQSLVDWLDALSLREGRRLTSEFAGRAVDALGAASLERLVLVAIGCFVYGGVFVIESIGLWLGKRWAEYLTTIVTASLLPFELYELMEKVSAPRLATLVVNLLVLGYLIWKLVSQRPGREGGESRVGTPSP